MNDTPPFVIANLKANKTWDQVSTWLDVLGPKALSFPGTVLVCPSSPFLAAASQKIKSANWLLALGSQDISKFEQGAYTGEVAASQIADLCQYAIIGHSERRQNFAEGDKILAQKVENANKANLIPIFCVQDSETPIPGGVTIVVYEPIFAIGTGNPDTPQNAKAVSKKLKAKSKYTVLYGGSVTERNVKSFIEKDVIDGVLIGTASLDPHNFLKVIEDAKY